MKKQISTLLAIATAFAALAVTASAATAGPATKKQPVVTVAMKDPGCHWFDVNGKYSKTLSVTGATEFRNLDEAALIFRGPHFFQKLAVGKTIAVTAPGVYHITMVGQAPDDNHLKLFVR